MLMGIGIFIGIVIAVPIVLMLSGGRDRHRHVDSRAYQVLVELHAIRRRFQLAEHRFELRRDAAHARRALQADLHKLDEGRERD
jgi:hypothetical protein